MASRRAKKLAYIRSQTWSSNYCSRYSETPQSVCAEVLLQWQCRKTRLANQLFTNISQHSPPLSLYPASQRVTYLYYLGRFHFSNNHFYRAQLCLQEAYNQCHAKAVSQRQ